MTSRPGNYQVNFNGGEIDPAAHGSTHLKTYYSGAARMARVRPVPQGGFTLMPGSAYRAPVRRALATAATATPAAVTTAAAGVLWTVGVSAAGVAAIDLSGLGGGADDAARVQIEVETGGLWVAIGGSMALRKAAAAYRQATAPGAVLTITGVRLRLLTAPAASRTISTGTVAVLTETTGEVTGVKLWSFAYSTAESYMVVAAPGHADVFTAEPGGFAYAGCFGCAYTGEQLADVSFVQRRDTALLFHVDVAPRRLLRIGASQEWALDAAPFTFIPDVDYGGNYTHTADIWMLYVQYATGTFGAGQAFEITVSGETTAQVFISEDGTASSLNIKNALEALPSIEPGLTVAQTGGSPGLLSFQVTFSGALNIGSNFDVSGRCVSSTNTVLTCSRTQKGKKGGEALFSPSRGYPATGIFFQERLVLAGFKAKRNAFLASRTGEYFDFNIEAQAASGAILVAMDTDGAEEITHLKRGRHLIVMTTEAEWFVSDKALVRSTPPNLVRSSPNGTRRAVPVCEHEGAIIYVAAAGTKVFAATYADTAAGYDSAPISLLASHLIDNVQDAALQRADSTSDADRYWLVRGDGLLVSGSLLRNQEVSAFTRWPTEGQVKAVAVDGANTAWIVVARLVGGISRLQLETLDDDLLYDCTVTRAPNAATVTGLAHLEGGTVYATADGWRLGPFTVTGGAITLDEPAATVTVGLWTAPAVETLPLKRDVGPALVVKRPARIHTIKLDLIETEELAVGANGRRARSVPMGRFGDPATGPLAPQTRPVAVRGIMGFQPDAVATFTQTQPGKMTLRNVTLEARL